jgi:hypothetical protein
LSALARNISETRFITLIDAAVPFISPERRHQAAVEPLGDG